MQKIVLIIFFLATVSGGAYFYMQQAEKKRVFEENKKKYLVEQDPAEIISNESAEQALEAFEKQFVDVENAWREQLVEVFKDEWNFKEEKWDAYVKLREEYQDKKMDFYENMADTMENEGRQYDGPIEDVLLQDKKYLKFEENYRAKLQKLIGDNLFAQYETIRQDFNLDWEKNVPGEGPIILIEF